MKVATAWTAVAVQLGLLVALLLVPARTAPPILLALGIALVVSGAVLGLGSALAMGRSLTPSPLPRADAALQTSGPFRLVRHPIYSALLLAAVGVVATRPSLFTVATWCGLAALLTAKSVWEEKELLARFPGYAAYRASTPRFVPRVRLSRT